MFNISRLQFKLESGCYGSRILRSGSNYLKVESSHSVVDGDIVTIHASGREGQLEQPDGWTAAEVRLQIKVTSRVHDGDTLVEVTTVEPTDELLRISVAETGVSHDGRNRDEVGRLQVGRNGQFGLILANDLTRLQGRCGSYKPAVQAC